MPIVLDSFADPPLTGDIARLKAKANCVMGIRNLALTYHHGDVCAGIASEIARKNPTCASSDIRNNADTYLRTAWSTEASARLNLFIGQPETLRVGALTLPVAAYYCLFNAVRALLAQSGSAADNHSKIQRTFSKQYVSRLPLPWCCTLDGDPNDLSKCRFMPPTLLSTLSAVDPLASSRHSSEEMMFATLRMARRWTFESERRKWLANNRTKAGKPRRRLPKSARDRLLSEKMWPTTILDFVYGLRVRSNYMEASEFASGAPDYSFRDFHEGMLFLVDVGLMVVESLMAVEVGTASMKRHAVGWMRSMQPAGAWASEALGRRVAALDQHGCW